MYEDENDEESDKSVSENASSAGGGESSSLASVYSASLSSPADTI
jgi:formiminotetrahydrofolate cyclodeaminase